ncbi:MAG: dUTP diphosphatase [Thauera sp.]|jgi:dUTP pyrophosphatase|nr:dUTP diphosphatase [Thauera sp.]
MHIKIKPIHPDAQPPRYATHGAACFDLVAIDSAEIPPMFAATLRTGLAFEIPTGYKMAIYSRSGHGFKSGIRLSNSVGVIDSDYRGEIMVRLHNDGDRPFVVEPGDRIAQAEIVPVERIEFEMVADLSDTDRATAGSAVLDGKEGAMNTKETITQICEKYLAILRINPQRTEAAIRDMEAAFYAGAITVFTMVECAESEADVKRIAKSLRDDLEAFVANVVASEIIERARAGVSPH